ncbi:MAG TPA: metallophosphoesterase, partial [Salinimicrobium sp.]|nr:metallophosphoesterase [Salinimicrobium sp.]
MTIQYASDLHLEFHRNEEFLKQNPIKPVGDILVMAGDIVPFSKIRNFDYFFDSLSANFEMVYWIPGNHEYYHSELTERFESLYENIRNNVVLLNN